MTLEKKVYPIIERRQEGRFIILIAGKRWTDEQRRIRFEGFELPIPEEVSEKETLFAMSSVERFDNAFRMQLISRNAGPSDAYLITDIAGVEECGDVWSHIILSREMLATLTGLSPRAIDEAFERISLRWTYDLLARLPRTIKILQDAVEVTYGTAPPIGLLDLCTQIMDGSHPLDRK